jgi:hypothetical protein
MANAEYPSKGKAGDLTVKIVAGALLGAVALGGTKGCVNNVENTQARKALNDSEIVYTAPGSDVVGGDVRKTRPAGNELDLFQAPIAAEQGAERLRLDSIARAQSGLDSLRNQ